MRQQVNLYQPVFRRERRVLSARALAQCLGLAAIALAAVQGFAWWQVEGLRGQVRQLEQQQVLATERLSAAQGRVPRRDPSPLLERERARLERVVAGRSRILETLRGGDVEPSSGFSEILAGLARQRVPGLWLTAVRIQSGGRRLEIRGAALRPELVPVLVQRLSSEPVFVGMKFQTLRLDRTEEGEGRLDFVLRTDIEGAT
ncbi:MAG: PilN domain-containing protein [Ectothiorhodospiraceae bacterium]|nr:PilN domain-containing protein [Chromatiales bacterium]MCP5155028.1 PilN domain-containing protein [Ectothiorhodospiraceae bacterium]